MLSSVYSFGSLIILAVVLSSILNFKDKPLFYLSISVLGVYLLGMLSHGYIWNSSVSIFGWYLKEIVLNMVIILLVMEKIKYFGHSGIIDKAIITICVISSFVNLIEYFARNVFGTHVLMPFYYYFEKTLSISIVFVLYLTKLMELFRWMRNKGSSSSPPGDI